MLPEDRDGLLDLILLFVFGLDHLLTEQEASAAEIEAVRQWLGREGICLLVGPHHDVGISMDMNERAMEYAHHGDALVPRQQRFELAKQPIDLARPHPFTEAGNREFNSFVWLPPAGTRARRNPDGRLRGVDHTVWRG